MVEFEERRVLATSQDRGGKGGRHSPPPTPKEKTFEVRNDSNGSSRSQIHPQPWCGQHYAAQENGFMKNVYYYGENDEKEKTPMCRIAELARYNKLKHEYKLMDESGPAHKKLFTVCLYLTPDQFFEGSGPSIKKAQQAAAEKALQDSTFKLPPEKSAKKSKKETLAPTTLLQHVTQRLGLPEPVYRHFPTPPQPKLTPLHISPLTSPDEYPTLPLNPMLMMPPGIPRSPLTPFSVPPPPPPPTTILSPSTPTSPPVRLPSNFQPSRPPPTPLFIPPPPKVFCVGVVLGKGYPLFVAHATTSIEAKQNAAKQALLYLGPMIAALDVNPSPPRKSESTDENGNGEDRSPEEEEKREEDSSPTPKYKLKSVISKVHECALQLKMNVEFEVIHEEGPPHERSYMVRCRLVPSASDQQVITEDGHGKKKKTAKQDACAKILAHLESSPLFIASSLYKSTKKVTNVNRELKRKTIVKDKKMDPEYGHQINPVSRLIQVQQARNEPEPVFEFIAERGQSRYKEFVVEVMCGTETAQGSGPNKRLAKRAAAEAMLGKIGYVKAMPQPGKSLLKRRTGDDGQLEIGVFNAEDFISRQDSEGSVEKTWTDQPWKELTCDVADVNENRESRDSRESGDSRESRESRESRDSENSPESKKGDSPSPTTPTARRRVTFSNEVSACPPPDDSNYPETLITPLKSEVVLVTKMKRRSKDSKKVLSIEQRLQMATMAQVFIRNHEYLQKNPRGSPNYREMPDESIGMFSLKDAQSSAPSVGMHDPRETPRHRLERIADSIKFSVQYTNFPQNGGDQGYFALVTLGVDKPIVCHGSGPTTDDAAEMAAYNALKELAKLPAQPEAPPPVSPSALSPPGAPPPVMAAPGDAPSTSYS